MTAPNAPALPSQPEREAVAEAINRARYVAGGILPIPLADEDKGAKAYVYRLD